MGATGTEDSALNCTVLLVWKFCGAKVMGTLQVLILNLILRIRHYINSWEIWRGGIYRDLTYFDFKFFLVCNKGTANTTWQNLLGNLAWKKLWGRE
jgi:hypothetical protein